jgi:hypothetical protein
MSILHWLFRRKKPPQIYLGDVQMHLDWNVVSSFCHYFGAPVQSEPPHEQLQKYFAEALEIPVYEKSMETAAGDQLLHLAITDLRYGFLASLNTNDYWIPLLIRPSVTFYGYLLDIDSGQVVAEKRVTRKASWLHSANPVLFAWSFFTGDFGPTTSKPMTDVAARKALNDLKKMAAHTAQTGHLLEKNRMT